MNKKVTVHCHPSVIETEKAARDWRKSLMNSNTMHRSGKNPLRIETADQIELFICVPLRLEVDRLGGIIADEIDFAPVLAAASRQLIAAGARVTAGRRSTP